jgi:multidrug efflux pump subunit AcrA (membrane-fusion protein)
MDLKKTKNNKGELKPKIFFGGVTVCIVVLLMSFYSVFSSEATVKRSELLISSVKKGDVRVEVEGYGVLRSDRQLLINALTEATVKEVVLKPGALVTPDSIIARLSNPVLQQQKEREQQALAQDKANLRQLKLSQKLELLNEKSNYEEMAARFVTAKAKLEAQQGLIDAGIVSVLDFKESEVLEAQFKKLLEIHSKKIEALELINKEAINIQLEQIKQQEGKLKIAQERLDRLTVKAGFSGVLQRLSIELGQSLVAGQEIAMIGSVQDLIALVRVPQSKVQQVLVGQQVIVDTRRDKIYGTVSRIDPVVVDNTVEIEIVLPDELPLSARPMQNVDAVIITETLKDITYIDRPVNYQGGSEIALFLLDSENNYAVRTQVKLGKSAGRYVEILNGAKVNDKFVVSDLSFIEPGEIRIGNY